MSKPENAQESRRRFLMLVGGSAIAVPVAGLTGCSSDEPAAPAPAAEPAAAPESAAADSASQMAPEPAAEAPAEASAASGELPQLSESDPTATSLGYVHEATAVDIAKYPRYEAGQQCSNCALYQGDADAEWAGCSIFPGKAVKATGWCSVYAPKAG